MSKTFTFIQELKNTLESLDFVYIGEYPHDVDIAKTNRNSPSVLIGEGDEYPAEFEQSRAITRIIEIPIYLYVSTRKSRIKTANDYQKEIEDALLSDSFLADSGAYCIDWTGVEKGGYLFDFTGYDIGYNNMNAMRKINFQITLQRGR